MPERRPVAAKTGKPAVAAVDPRRVKRTEPRRPPWHDQASDGLAADLPGLRLVGSRILPDGKRVPVYRREADGRGSRALGYADDDDPPVFRRRYRAPSWLNDDDDD
jgi:hypothetical protein